MSNHKYEGAFLIIYRPAKAGQVGFCPSPKSNQAASFLPKMKKLRPGVVLQLCVIAVGKVLVQKNMDNNIKSY